MAFHCDGIAVQQFEMLAALMDEKKTEPAQLFKRSAPHRLRGLLLYRYEDFGLPLDGQMLPLVEGSVLLRIQHKLRKAAPKVRLTNHDHTSCDRSYIGNNISDHCICCFCCIQPSSSKDWRSARRIGIAVRPDSRLGHN